MSRLPPAQLSQRRNTERCKVSCKKQRCEALVWKQHKLVRCCLCIAANRSSEYCHHHRKRQVLTRMPTVKRRAISNSKDFTLKNRRGSEPNHPRRLATVNDGVEVRRSKINIAGRRVDFNGLFAKWNFHKGDFITIYDGIVTDSQPNLIPQVFRSHVQSVGLGSNAKYRIIGYQSDGSPRVQTGHGAASIVSSTSGTNRRPNSKIVMLDDFKYLVPYVLRKFKKDGSHSDTTVEDVPLVVLVATEHIRQNDEILRSYLVRT